MDHFSILKPVPWVWPSIAHRAITNSYKLGNCVYKVIAKDPAMDVWEGV